MMWIGERSLVCFTQQLLDGSVYKYVIKSTTQYIKLKYRIKRKMYTLYSPKTK